MKKAFLTVVVYSVTVACFAQMHVKKPNFTSFNTDKVFLTATLQQNSSAKAQQHPEYGVLPYNAECEECIELLDKRTIDSRLLIKPDNAGRMFSQKSYFPLHYKKFEGDVWNTIDSRLRPDAMKPGVYSALNQPVPTKCDMNSHTSSITESGFEFEFNKNLQIFFFDEASVYTQKQNADYSTYTIGEEGLSVKNMWSGIDMEQIFTKGEIKTNFVIPAPLQLPISSGYMVIEDHFTLPSGFTIDESVDGGFIPGAGYKGDYIIRNAQGDSLIVIEKPVYLDAKAFGTHGSYRLTKNGNDYTLQTLVPVDWITKTDHTYPIMIDPTVFGRTKMGDFRLSGISANLGFTTMSLGSCDYHMQVPVPGRSKLTNSYVDVEYTLTYDPFCGTPPLPAPFCTFSQVTMEVQSDECNTTTGLLSCNPAQPPYTGTCTTDSNLVPGANALKINSFVPNYLTCITPQCADYLLDFTLKNRDSICLDNCFYLCARGNMWQMTVEACRVEGNITQDKTQICAGEPVTFTAHPNCGVPPYHYVWLYGNTRTVVYGSDQITIYPQQDVNMTCIIYDTCSVDSAVSNDLSVIVTASPPADAGPDVNLCEGGNAFLGGNPTTTIGPTVTWTGSTPQVQGWLNGTGIQNPFATVPAGTVDTFFYVVRTQDFTCFRTDTVYVFSSPGPTANAGPDATLCGGGTITLGGTPSSNAANVTWTGETPTVTSWLSSTAAFNPQANIPVGTVDTFFYVLDATTAGCFESDTMRVFSNPSPVADAGGDVRFCEGGTATIGGNPTGTAGSNVTWTAETPLAESWLSSNTASNPQINVPAGTVDTFYYVATASDPLCARTDTLMVYSAANPTVTIDSSGTTRICTNQTVTLSTIGSFNSYSWNTGDNTQSITVNQTGSYSVTITDANGCTAASNIISVSSVAVPNVTVYPDTLIMYGDSVMLYTDINLGAASIDSFNWFPTVNVACNTCTNPVVHPEDEAQYYGVNIYSGGCTATDSSLIRVIFPNNFYIPNAFTPNGDGNNDNFYIMAQGGVKVILFQVFNRWGEKMHEGAYPWDGKYKTKPAPPGVYVYVFKLGLFGDDNAIFRKGSVTLIK